jgi:uncharacterized protein with PQ loop repeat
MDSIYGWIATSITSVYKIPQIVTLYRAKHTGSLSILSISIQGIGYIFYAIHGYTKNDLPIITMGSISFFQSLILFILYCKYRYNLPVTEN